MLRARLNIAATHAKLMAPVLGLPQRAAELGPDSAESALSNCLYDTALIAERPSLEAVAAISGTEQTLFGSDWPFASLAYPAEGDPQPALTAVFGKVARPAIKRSDPDELANSPPREAGNRPDQTGRRIPSKCLARELAAFEFEDRPARACLPNYARKGADMQRFGHSAL